MEIDLAKIKELVCFDFYDRMSFHHAIIGRLNIAAICIV